MTVSMFVEYMSPRPITESNTSVNSAISIAIPRSWFFCDGVHFIRGIASKRNKGYRQLIACVSAACEQLFSLAVITRVVVGRCPVFGSATGDLNDNVAFTVSTLAIVAALALKSIGRVIGVPVVPRVYVAMISVFSTHCL